MRDAIFQILLAGGAESKALVKFKEIGLCTNLNGLVAKELPASLDTFFHQNLSHSRAPR